MGSPFREVAAAVLMLAVTGCTFGMLRTDECLTTYREGMGIAVGVAAARGAVVEEGYSFCVDGRRRAEAMLPVLAAHGFATERPSKHFEVPGGWCLLGKRAAAPQRFDAAQSLQSICAIVHASRAYMTGGRLTTSSGSVHYVRSALDRKARDDLDRRLGKVSG